MAKFDHPNVMGLIGVSLSNKTPFLVMPYMANGCLLSYLRKKRAELTIENESSTELVIGIKIGSKNISLCITDTREWVEATLNVPTNCKRHGVFGR